jgi:hypothetical protein
MADSTEANGFLDFDFLVHRVRDLQDVLLDTRVPVPRVASAPEAFLRAGRRSRKAG